MLNPSPIRTVPWIRRVLKSNKCRILASLNEIFLSNRPFLRFMAKGLKSIKWRLEKETSQDHTRESMHILVVTSSPKKRLALICKQPVGNICKERRFTKYTQISWKGRNFTFNAHVLKLPEPNRNNQYSNQKFLNSNNFPDSKISTSTRIRIHSRTQDENMLPIFLWEYGQQSMRRKAREICILTFHGKELGSILLRNRVKISGFSVHTIPES